LAKAKTKKESKPARTKETPMEFVGSMAVILVTGLFIITFVTQAFEIPSSSMEQTLLIGDHVFVDRISFAPETRWLGPLVPYGEVRRGDIVVFLSPAEPGLYVVKRIIAVPGDRIHLRDGVVYLNGQPQDEPYVIRKRPYSPFRDDFPAVPPGGLVIDVTPEWRAELPQLIEGDDLVVPPGQYFAMGDNRDDSRDSRYWGFIPRANIIGRPMFIYWSFETPPSQYQKTGMVERIKFIGRIVVRFFADTRWSRTFKLVE
jgi:signal peptidase I